ncbi:MAG: translation initiation factor IF-2 [Candidatus Micrarchaeia archaeon]
MPIRQPIVVVMGHVDHGKTSLLDAIRSTNVAKKEAGAITQHIGASEVDLRSIQCTCEELLKKSRMNFTIPGLLFIDTPGHESFTRLRERGGSIADIAVLVVDIAQGFQPQTIESIRILRQFKTPFIVAANKVDLVNGWREQKGGCACGSILSNIGAQREDVQLRMDELLYKAVGKLSELGIESERFDRVRDFTKQVAIVPVSAKTGEGLPELLLSIAGLSQKFLENELKTEVEGPGKGSVLELREEKGLGTTIDVIIYDGVLRKNDTVIFGTINGSASAKVRGLLKPKLRPTGEGDRFEYVDKVTAASGVKIYAPGLEGALSGSPLIVDSGDGKSDGMKEINEMIRGIMFESEKSGVIVKADTLGSLEALTKLLSGQGVEIKSAGVGRVAKKDIATASAIGASEPLKAVVLAFNVPVADDAADEAARAGVKVFSSNVIYSLCDDYAEWLSEQKKKSSQSAENRLPLPAKILALPRCTFRASKPAIFGVEILGGRLRKGVRLMTARGEIIGEVREVQKEGKGVNEGKRGEQLAISVEGAICGKTFIEGDTLYSYIGKREGEELAACCTDMDDDSKALLLEILGITDRKLI